jgi:uncharacterized protein (TIGR04562 family)
MPKNFFFNEDLLTTVAGGRSAIDLRRLDLQSIEDADAFLECYGFDWQNENHQKTLWQIHRRAIVLLEERLGFSGQIPEKLRDQKSIEDLRVILTLASGQGGPPELQRWACSILRVMHVFVHAEHDLFSSFGEMIQNQILGPIQNSIFHDGSSGQSFLCKSSSGIGATESIPLVKFEVKPFKTSSSTVIKLLARSDALAMNVFDRLGVRFITESMYDAFRVMRFLIQSNVIAFPHVIPDQSSNNIFPVDLFCEQAKVLGELDQLNDAAFEQALTQNEHRLKWVRKENEFSASSYKFIKFIARKLIRIDSPEKQNPVRFFFPFEVQIMDKNNYEKVLHGPSMHKDYKERQREAARKRVAPEL